MPGQSRVFLDEDDKALNEVVEDITRLQDKFDLGEAIIYESSPSYLYDSSFLGHGIVRYGSFHVRFPKDVRRWEEVKDILDESNAHDGFVYFSKQIGDITLRVSEQKDSPKPKIIGVIKNGSQ